MDYHDIIVRHTNDVIMNKKDHVLRLIEIQKKYLTKEEVEKHGEYWYNEFEKLIINHF